MAIEFYSLTDASRKQPLFSISHRDFDLLEDVWDQYQKLTGLSIDTYGTSRVYPGHVDLIKKLLLVRSDKAAKALLLSLDKSDAGFLVMGD